MVDREANRVADELANFGITSSNLLRRWPTLWILVPSKRSKCLFLFEWLRKCAAGNIFLDLADATKMFIAAMAIPIVSSGLDFPFQGGPANGKFSASQPITYYLKMLSILHFFLGWSPSAIAFENLKYLTSRPDISFGLLNIKRIITNHLYILFELWGDNNSSEQFHRQKFWQRKNSDFIAKRSCMIKNISPPKGILGVMVSTFVANTWQFLNFFIANRLFSLRIIQGSRFWFSLTTSKQIIRDNQICRHLLIV